MSLSTVSVVIPCFNQGRYLTDSIESVLLQSQTALEIIVVDDGSTDSTAETARRYKQVRYFHQSNQGLSAARNAGLSKSHGDYILFLDADDLLEPHGIATGAALLDSNPDWAFVSGGYRHVSGELTAFGKDHCRPVHQKHYAAFLRGNYIGMHATVMYRRATFDAVGGFDTKLRACEDYDMYLRVSRSHPVGSHGEVVASYRRHDANMSNDSELMLRTALQVHQSQFQFAAKDPVLKGAWKAGRRRWWKYFGNQILRQFLQSFPRSMTQLRTLRMLARVLRNYPLGLASLKAKFRTWVPHSLLRSLRRYRSGVKFGSFRSTTPVGNAGAKDTVAARYCDRFLETHNGDIKGDVLHVGSGVCPVARLSEVPDESQDCVVCICPLQTPSLQDAIHHFCRILKPSGILLAVLPGVALSSSSDSAHGAWRFTHLSVRRLFEVWFPRELEVKTLGNAVTTLAELHRLPAETLREDDFLFRDPQQQLLITVRALKDPSQS